MRAARKVFGQRLDNLAGAQNAEVEIGKQRDNAPSFAGRVMQDDGSGVGNAGGGCGDDAVAKFDLLIS